MKDYITIGSSPCDETCQQVGSPDYAINGPKECKIFARQLDRQFPNKPEGCIIKVKSFPHDFGTYHEVVVIFDTENEDETKYAFNIENNTPEVWDDIAKQELIAANLMSPK